MNVRRGRRRPIAAGIALLCALSASAWQGWIHWASRDPSPDLTVPATQQVQVRGATYRIEDFRAGPELPAAYGDDPTVHAPAGAVLVLVIITTEIVDDQGHADENYCEATLVDQEGRTWRTGSDLTTAVRQPEAYSCTGTSEQPIRPHQPLRMGFSFAIPADALDEVDVRLSIPAPTDYVINFSR